MIIETQRLILREYTMEDFGFPYGTYMGENYSTKAPFTSFDGVAITDTFKFEGGNTNGGSSTIALELVETSRNIDHVATLRNARGGHEPDVIAAARICKICFLFSKY